MITRQDSNGRQCLILAPNRSADWQTTKRLIIAIALVSTLIAGGFTYIGAWVILPFAGMEVLALSAALYWANWNQYYRQVLWFEGNEVRIEKGFYRPRDCWRWQRQSTAIHVSEAPGINNSLAIHLAQGATRVAIGEFLNAHDSQMLLKTLKELGLNTRSYSRDGDLTA